MSSISQHMVYTDACKPLNKNAAVPVARSNLPDYDKKIEFSNVRLTEYNLEFQSEWFIWKPLVLFCAVYLATVSSNMKKLEQVVRQMPNYKGIILSVILLFNNVKHSHAFIAKHANKVSTYLRRHPEQAILAEGFDARYCFPQSYFVKGLTGYDRYKILQWLKVYDLHMSNYINHWVSVYHKALRHFRDNNYEVRDYNDSTVYYHRTARYRVIRKNQFNRKTRQKPLMEDESRMLYDIFDFELEECFKFIKLSDFKMSYRTEYKMHEPIKRDVVRRPCFKREIHEYSGIKALFDDDASCSLPQYHSLVNYTFVDVSWHVYTEFPPYEPKLAYYGCFKYQDCLNKSFKCDETDNPVSFEIETIDVYTAWSIQDFIDEIECLYPFDFASRRIESDWSELMTYCPKAIKRLDISKFDYQKVLDSFRTYQDYRHLGRYVAIKPRKRGKKPALKEEAITKYVSSKITRFLNRHKAINSSAAESPEKSIETKHEVRIQTITEEEAIANYKRSQVKSSKKNKVCSADSKASEDTSSFQVETEVRQMVHQAPQFNLSDVIRKAARKPATKIETSNAVVSFKETLSGYSIRSRLSYNAENLYNLMLNIADSSFEINYAYIRSIVMSYLIHDCVRTRRPITDKQITSIKRDVSFYMSTNFVPNFKSQSFDKAVAGLQSEWNHMTAEELACCKRNLLECVNHMFVRLIGYPIIHVRPWFFRLKGSDDNTVFK